MHRVFPLAAFAAGWLACTVPLRAQNVSALVVGDISPSCEWGKYTQHIQADVMEMTGLFMVHSPESRLQFSSRIFETDAESHPQAILQLLAELSPGPQDTLVVYYTGHGGADDRGQYLSLAGGKLYRHELRDAMLARQARLTVLLTDCCNVRGDGKSFGVGVPGPADLTDFTPFFKSLFVAPEGVVDITASAPGESAFFIPEVGPNQGLQNWGSLFTKSFVNLAESHRDRELTWDDMMLGLSVQVHVLFKQGYPDGAQATKGGPRQHDQNVYAIDYPGMPARQGARAGVTVRDKGGDSAMVVEVQPGYPASRVYDLSSGQYATLVPGHEIVQVNGSRVRSASDFTSAVHESPQIMRLLVRTATGERECLVRLRY